MSLNQSQKIKNSISFIKGKKNQGISDEFVFQILNRYLQDKFFKELFEKEEKLILKNKHFKNLVKEIRKELYGFYGLYQSKKGNKKLSLLEDLKSALNLTKVKEISRNILKLHTSSRERLNDYENLYSEILKLQYLLPVQLLQEDRLFLSILTFFSYTASGSI